VDSGPFSEDSY